MKLIFPYFFLALLFLGCKKDNPKPTAIASSSTTSANAKFDFLKLNHQWNYDGDIIIKIDSMVDSSTYRVFTQYGQNFSFYSHWISRGEYLKVYDDFLDEVESDATVMYKKDPKLGDTWSHNNSQGTVSYKVISVTDSVTTKLGKFACATIEISFSYAGNTQNTYWSPQYGLVYQDGLPTLNLVSKNF